ncbi:fibronectin type III domain-containing protein [Chitinimonas sp.]|uniref:fibronectin type III domain-containing protein n=1 Tax=Chitinimonas sp. TaxID=1934313 RepID=UPI0035B16D00
MKYHLLLSYAAYFLSTSIAIADSAPHLDLAGATFTLTIPYLEFGSGSSKLAYSAKLSSSTLGSFSLDSSSIRSTTLQTLADTPASIAAASKGYTLRLPYLEFASGGVSKAYSVTLTTSDLLNYIVDTSSLKEVAVRSTLSAPGAVVVADVDKQALGSSSIGSSSKLQVSWTAPTGYVVDHYEVIASEALMNTRVSVSSSATSTSATVTGLKAATSYAVLVRACQDAACAKSGSAAVVQATTPAEYWQLQGTGNTVASLTKPVADGNARLSATRFGAEAGANANTVQFYYGPKGVSGQSVASSGVVSASNSASYLSGFTSYANTSGVRSPSSASSGIKDIMTGQGVPLSAAMGAKVRLFFESNDVDGKTRIYSVDSVDGYTGRDFNSGTATTCSASSDYLPSGGCPATVVIGVEGDAVNPTSKIKAARQNKIGWPTLTDWRWDGAVGTFMVFTIDQISGCTSASHNHGYAVWNGTTFVPQFDASGCPKAFKSAQAALPMHIGGARYKMYFGDPSVTTGRSTSSNLPFVGPKKLIYGDGELTGNSTIVDFEDWESVGSGRNVVFVWPNGEVLNDTAEGYIDDFHFLTPTGSLDIQVLYLSITDGSVAPFAATAVLRNP